MNAKNKILLINIGNHKNSFLSSCCLVLILRKEWILLCALVHHIIIRLYLCICYFIIGNGMILNHKWWSTWKNIKTTAKVTKTLLPCIRHMQHKYNAYKHIVERYEYCLERDNQLLHTHIRKKIIKNNFFGLTNYQHSKAWLPIACLK